MDAVTVPYEFTKWSETMDATENIQKISDQVKTKVEEKTKKKYNEFKAVKYRESIKTVSHPEVKYIIKVHVGGSDYDHVYVFHLPCVEKADVSVLENKTKDDDLQPLLE